MTQPGDHIGGRYRLVERIGAGAMGVVWRAVDERLGRTVALKQFVIPADVDQFEAHAARERAMREGRIAARLNHPHAIAVFDVADHGGTPWLVMEYLAASSLAAVLAEQGPLPASEVAAIGHALADALCAAHAAGIVHRDIKPGNVLLGVAGGAEGVVKLTDFGISRAADDVTVTRTAVLSGTPAYLAPEVARGGEPTEASDVFALGATLYTAVEGQPPFGLNDNALALLHQVAGGQVLPPREGGPLARVLMALLRADPAQRPSMSLAREALRRVMAGEPLPAGLDGPVSVVAAGDEQAVEDRVDDQRPWGGRRTALLVAAGIAFAVLAGLLGLAATNGPPRPAAQAPVAAAPERTTAPFTTAAPPSSSGATSTTSTSTTTTTTVTKAPVSAVALQRAVAGYYSLLPKHPQQAWARLGPGMQAQGYGSYAAYWRKVDSVRALSASGDPASMTVRVLLVVRNDRRTTGEVHDLTLIRSGNEFLINSDSRVGVYWAPTTTRTRG